MIWIILGLVVSITLVIIYCIAECSWGFDFGASTIINCVTLFVMPLLIGAIIGSAIPPTVKSCNEYVKQYNLTPVVDNIYIMATVNSKTGTYTYNYNVYDDDFSPIDNEKLDIIVDNDIKTPIIKVYTYKHRDYMWSISSPRSLTHAYLYIASDNIVYD
jgi:hypothetical protein